MKSMNTANHFRRALFFGAAAAGWYGVISFIYTACLKISYPYMVNLGEPALFQAIRFTAEGKIPYHDLSQPPYSLVPYGPVYLWLSSFLHRWLTAPFVGGRCLTFVSTIFAACLIYLILRKGGVRRGFSMIASLIFISHPYTGRWGVQVNVDMTGVCVALAAFYCFWSYIQNDYKSRLFFAVGILFSVVAFFTKSSMMAVPAAFFSFLVFGRKFRSAVLFLVVEAIGVGLIYLILNHWSQGGYFFHTTYEIGKRQFFYQLIVRFWTVAIKDAPLLIVASLLGLSQAVSPGRRKFFGLYVVFAVFLTISLGKQGSDTNYFLEWCATSCLAVGFALDRFFSAFDDREMSIPKVWTQSLVYCLLLCQLCVWAGPSLDLRKVKNDIDKRREYFDRISLLIRKVPGKILSEDMSLLVANGKEIFYEPFPMGQMSYSGVWDQKYILAELNKQSFSAAILYFYAPALIANRTFTPEFLSAFNQNYQFVGRSAPPAEAVNITAQPLYFYAPKKDKVL